MKPDSDLPILDTLFDLPFNFIEKKLKKSGKANVYSQVDELLSNKVLRTNPYAPAYSLIHQQDVTLDQFDLDRHTIVAGKTGAGKNELLNNLIYRKLEEGKPVVFIDPKGDMRALRNFKAMNKKFNRKCYVFSELYPHSDSCNPVCDGDTSAIVDRIFSIFQWDQPYYRDANFNALHSAVKILKQEDRRISIRDILQTLVEKFKTDATMDIINKLQRIDSSAFGNLLSSEDAVSLTKIRRENASVYIGLSTLGFPEISRQVGKLFVYELMYHSYYVFGQLLRKEEVEDTPIFVMIDEFGSIATEDVVNLINKCRGAKLGMCLSFQTIYDLKSIHDTFMKQIISNTDNFFVGHCHDPQEAEFWSKVIGTKKSTSMTTQIENDEETGLGSLRETRDFIIHPDVLKKLHIGQFASVNMLPFNHYDLLKFHLVNFKELLKNEINPEDERLKKEKQTQAIADEFSKLHEIIEVSNTNNKNEKGRRTFSLSEY